MPYIPQQQREKLDPLLDKLCSVLADICEPKSGPSVEADGMLNYIFTRIILDGPHHNYVSIERGIGCLECCKLELYRRVAAPYEDRKRGENGEVYSED